jgi:hypothetical protein
MMEVRFIELINNREQLKKIANLALPTTDLPLVNDSVYLENHQYYVIERHLTYNPNSSKLIGAEIFIEKTSVVPIEKKSEGKTE